MGYIRDLWLGSPKRSSHWPKLRAEHLKRQPTCAACGRSKSLEVHHILSFHDHPELELDPVNLLTLCEAGPNCHLTFGHLRNWKTNNPLVVFDAALYLQRIKQYGPKSSPKPSSNSPGSS